MNKKYKKESVEKKPVTQLKLLLFLLFFISFHGYSQTNCKDAWITRNGGKDLYKFDASNETVTFIGTLPFNVNGIGYNSRDGLIYAAYNGTKLRVFNPRHTPTSSTPIIKEITINLPTLANGVWWTNGSNGTVSADGNYFVGHYSPNDGSQSLILKIGINPCIPSEYAQVVQSLNINKAAMGGEVTFHDDLTYIDNCTIYAKPYWDDSPNSGKIYSINTCTNPMTITAINATAGTALSGGGQFFYNNIMYSTRSGGTFGKHNMSTNQSSNLTSPTLPSVDCQSDAATCWFQACNIATPNITIVAPTCSSSGTVAGTATISNFEACKEYTYTFSPAGPIVNPNTGAITGFTCGVNYTVTANTAICTSSPASFMVACLTCAKVSGNVFNDPNAGNVNNSSQETNNVPVGMFANLINSSGNVVATTTVNTNGTYSFTGVAPGTYSVVTGTTQGTVGQPAPTEAWPTGWLNTGDFNGTPDTGNANTTPNVSSSFTVSSTDVTNINYGIQQPPTAVNGIDPIVPNPGGSISEPVTLTLFTGTDPTQGGTVDKIIITTMPAGATSITVGGNLYTSIPVGGIVIPVTDGVNTTTISVDPSFPGEGSVVITYVTVDNGGATSQPATVTQPFSAPLVNVSGNVFNDPNAGNVNNSTQETNTVPSSIFANLINSSGNVVATTTVSTNGTYSFSSVAAGTYTVVSGTTQGTVGQPAPAQIWPSGWLNTGDFNGTPDTGNTNTTPNVSATFTVGTTDVTNINFAIQQPPTAVNGADPSVVNPGGTISEPITLTLFTGTDPTIGGTVDKIIINTMPTGATSITVGGNLYTSIPFGGIMIPVTDGINSTTISVDPNFPGEGNVVITYITVDNAGATSDPATVTQPFSAPPVNVSGNVFNDPNAGNVNNSTQEVNNVPTGMFANLINSAGNVVATTTIGTNGTFNFANVAPGTYTVVSGTTQGTVGQPAPTEAWPTGWLNTGDFNGTPDTNNTNTTPNVSSAFTVASTDVTNINFAIQQPPTAVDGADPSVVNPGGTISEPVTLTLFTGTDPTIGGTVDKIIINTMPTGATSMTVGGNVFTSIPFGGIVISVTDGINSTPISVDPSFPGEGNVVITYVTVDNAGATSAPATVTQPFSAPPVNVSGNVFNDPNAGNVNNSTGTTNLVPSGMYANLINSAGNVVATTTIGTNGAFNFPNVFPGDYTVVSGTTQGTVGQPAPAQVWPTGWINTGDFNGTPDTGNTNTTPNVSAIFTVSSTDVTNINFGIRQPLSIGNSVWNDVNKDGIRQAGEPGIENATVKLYVDANNDGTPDDAAIQTVTTDANGLYVFDNLLQGNYIIGVTPPTGNSYTSSAVDEVNPNSDVDNNDNGINTVNGETRSGTIILAANTEPIGESPTNGSAIDANNNSTIDFGFFVCPTSFTFTTQNVCLNTTFNLTTIEPEGCKGGVWTKNGVVVANTNVNAGIYTYTYTNGTCVATGNVTLLANIPDYAPTISIAPSAVTGNSSIRVIIKLDELLNKNSCSPVYLFVPKNDSRFTFTYDPTATTIGGVSVRNQDWQFINTNPNFHIFKYVGNLTFPALGSSTFGYIGTYNPLGADGQSTFSVQLYQGSGGENNILNNIDSETLLYFK